MSRGLGDVYKRQGEVTVRIKWKQKICFFFLDGVVKGEGVSFDFVKSCLIQFSLVSRTTWCLTVGRGEGFIREEMQAEVVFLFKMHCGLFPGRYYFVRLTNTAWSLGKQGVVPHLGWPPLRALVCYWRIGKLSDVGFCCRFVWSRSLSHTTAASAYLS